MDICIYGARENNLKGIDVKIPIGQIIGITGVSGSGKSTLAKDVIARYGYKSYSLTLPSYSKGFIADQKMILVDGIDHLPATLMIDVVNSISNPNSTLATVTGLHKMLRDLYSQFGVSRCPRCETIFKNDVFEVLEGKNYKTYVELKLDMKYKEREKYLQENTVIDNILYYDENGAVTQIKSKRAYCRIFFTHKKLSLKKMADLIRKSLGVSLRVLLAEDNCREIAINLEREVLCEHCSCVSVKRTMSLFSFNVVAEEGGGACSACGGTGKNIALNLEKFITYDKPIGKGGIPFIGEKGLQYTTVTEKFIDAVCKKYMFTLENTVASLNANQKNMLLFGSKEKIKFTDRQGANNGKKEEPFKGVVNYLTESYKKGKGRKNLEPYFATSACSYCGGSRLDPIANETQLMGYAITSLLSLTVEELYRTLTKLSSRLKDVAVKTKLARICDRLEILIQVGCGYLTLDRESTTLSGGELQRLRLCAFLGSKIRDMCIILDEPTTGLHSNDMHCIAEIIFELKRYGHTVVLVEHNKQLLQICDYIVDLGPSGGNNGGYLMFADQMQNLGYYTTPTAQYLIGNKTVFDGLTNLQTNCSTKQIIHLKSLHANNIYNEEVSFPLESIISICGVSGSGKSTFVNKCLIPVIQEEPSKYGVSGIENLGQKNAIKSVASNVGSLLRINDKIARLYADQVHSKDASSFMVNSKSGKCTSCNGRGVVEAEDRSEEACPECEGRMFDDQTLSITFKNRNIYEMLSTPIEELNELLGEYEHLSSIFSNCIEVGVGYLSLLRTSKTLSKGEIQRIKLVAVLSSKKTKQLFVLDEPTKGLHNRDVSKLYQFIKKVVDNGNTVLAVEHNLEFIVASDYVIEFGPGAGKKGGRVVFSGPKTNIRESDSPTGEALRKLQKIEGTVSNGGIITPSETMIAIVEGRKILIEKNRINRLTLPSEIIQKLFDHVNKEYLRVLSPTANFIASGIHDDGDCMLYGLPVIRIVDSKKGRFSRKSQVVDVLNIGTECSSLFETDVSSNRQRQAFDPSSQVGKCRACKGKGVLEMVDMDMLFDDGILIEPIERLLRKRTNYSLAKRYLIKNYQIDIAKPLSAMDDEEYQVFIFGDKRKIFLDKGKEYFWQGLNRSIIQELRYLESDSLAKIIKDSKEMRRCVVCGGRYLNGKYRTANFCGLLYNEVMDGKISVLYEILMQNQFNEVVAFNKLRQILGLLEKFHMSHWTLFTPVAELTEHEQITLQLIAYLGNPLLDSLLVLNGLDWVQDQKTESILMEELIEVLPTNTVVINEPINRGEED